MTGAPAPAGPPPAQRPAPAAAAPAPPGGVPRAVKVARATAIPNCTNFVDAGAAGGGNGTAQKPHKTIAAGFAAAKPGAVICVAEGVYAETLKPGKKYFTLAGGSQRSAAFKVRASAAYVSKARGKGGSFLRIEDPGPKEGQLTAIDGFEITGYAQAIVLKSAGGRWAPTGYAKDDVTSPALRQGRPRGATDKNPERVGARIELGAYGNSAEASYVR